MEDVLRSQLAEKGYSLHRNAGHGLLVEVLEALGRVLHVEEVLVRPESAALLRSRQGLSLHTDHHRADLIAWLCIAQAEQGGETLLVDAREAYGSLPAATRAVLERVMLAEHSMFAGDSVQHPLVTIERGVPRFYYSFWLAEGAMPDEHREAFDAFTAAVRGRTPVRITLQPRDVLVIDNRRMLHGRTSIEGTAERHLRRYWLEAATPASREG